MKEDEAIDYGTITKHTLRMAAGGVAGLVIQGSNGEAVHLDNSERSELIKHVRATLDSNGYQDRVIIAGCGAASLKQTLRLAKEAKEAGAAFALILPPNYWSVAMTKPVLVSYFTEVADKSELPVMIYNFPLVANGISFDSDTFIELSKHRNIVGAKLTCGVGAISGLD
jgi:4-hydroxy-2-oxoglutarate aldolase